MYFIKPIMNMLSIMNKTRQLEAIFFLNFTSSGSLHPSLNTSERSMKIVNAIKKGNIT